MTLPNKHAKRNTTAWKRLRREVINRDGHVCRYCGKVTLEDVRVGHPLKTTVDHIIPVVLDGTLVLDPGNCIVACWTCNNSKGGRAPGVPSKRELSAPTTRLKVTHSSRDWKSPTN